MWRMWPSALWRILMRFWSNSGTCTEQNSWRHFLSVLLMRSLMQVCHTHITFGTRAFGKHSSTQGRNFALMALLVYGIKAFVAVCQGGCSLQLYLSLEAALKCYTSKLSTIYCRWQLQPLQECLSLLIWHQHFVTDHTNSQLKACDLSLDRWENLTRWNKEVRNIRNKHVALFPWASRSIEPPKWSDMGINTKEKEWILKTQNSLKHWN